MLLRAPATGLQAAREAGWLIASELRAVGVDLCFAPCVDLDWGVSEVIGNRAIHKSAEVVSELSLAYMQGMRQAGMAAVAKHFPGHGAVTADSHHALPEDERSKDDLYTDMRPYESLIGDNLHGIMMAHIRYSAIEPQIASLSEYWMQTVLRGEFSFQGAIFSDDMCMAGAEVGGTSGI